MQLLEVLSLSLGAAHVRHSVMAPEGYLVPRGDVPDEVDLKIEFEIEDDGAEFEIELSR